MRSVSNVTAIVAGVHEAMLESFGMAQFERPWFVLESMIGIAFREWLFAHEY